MQPSEPPQQPYQPPTGPMPPPQPWYPPPQPPPQWPQPVYPPPYPYQPPWPRPMNHKAEQAQTFGCLGLLLTPLGIVAVILGIMALSEIHLTGEDGAKQAKTGLVLGCVSIVAMLAYYFLYLAH